MKFLSKQLLIGLLAINSAVLLHGAANEEMIGFADACIAISDQLNTNCSSYSIKTSKFPCYSASGDSPTMQMTVEYDAVPGASVNVDGPCSKCQLNGFGMITSIEPHCINNHRDGLIAGASSAFANPENATEGTDIIIVPDRNSSFTNMHTLIQENSDAGRRALRTVWQFVQEIASYMAEDAMFWLEIHVGEARQNNMKHFVVHFKSDTPVTLNSKASRMRSPWLLPSPKIEKNYVAVHRPATFFTPKLITRLGMGAAVLAVAAYGLYSWWTKK